MHFKVNNTVYGCKNSLRLMGTLAVRLLTEEYLLAVYSLLVANLTPDCTTCISQGMTGECKKSKF